MTRLFAGTPFDRPPHCERCEKPETDCECPPIPEPDPVCVPPHRQTAKISIEKRRKGKVVTLVRGLKSEETDLAGLLTRLKTTCGAGGTLQGDSIEIQGRHTERIAAALTAIGYKVKGAAG